MSQDDIVFDDVKYREPERLRRPDRDRRWACLAYEVPGAADLPIFLDRQTADTIERHALRDTTVELGGILLGKECVDDETGEPFVWITQSLEAKHYENTQASFTYTHDSWEEITRERDRLHPDLDIVGWYHTHPDFGVFLSGHDLFIHRNFFAQRLQVAYVVDPIRQTRGFFQWRDDDLDPVGGFIISAARGDRLALTRLVDDLENIPHADSGGGGLSPRLEAELIAMLTRPSQPMSNSIERAQTAALFSLIGVMVGVLGLLAVLWLNTLHRSVLDQAEAIKDLEKATERSAATQRLAFDTLISDDGGAVLSDKIAGQYEKQARELDEARRRLKIKDVTEDALSTQNKTLIDDNKSLKKDLAYANKVVEEYDALKKDAPDVRSRLTKLQNDSERKSRLIAEYEEIVGTDAGKKALTNYRRYEWTWYVAVAGWGVALLFALGLFAALSMRPPGTGEPPPESAPEGPPPHRIT